MKRKVIINSLTCLLALVAPFGTVIAAFMTIVWVNRPGIDGILVVYAALIAFEALALGFLTSPRRAWAPSRVLLFPVFAVASVSAPFIMFVYALFQVGPG